jgi:hypothetical protein
MKEFEQRFIVKYFHLKGRGNRRITAELENTFQGSALSRETVQRWLRKFKSGDLSRLDEIAQADRSQFWDIPKDTKLNQYYFIDTVLPNLYSEKRRVASCKSLPSFAVRIDNSMGHNGAKITEKLKKRHIVRAPHLPYSPDLSPCDFWLFGILKQKMKERAFQSEEQILTAITESWNELTFEDIRRVFHNWMEYLIWVIANTGKYYQSQMVWITFSFTGSSNSPRGSEPFYPLYRSEYSAHDVVSSVTSLCSIFGSELPTWHHPVPVSLGCPALRCGASSTTLITNSVR